jgi:hypothetical protein
MSQLSDFPADGVSSADEGDPSIIPLDSRRSRRERAQAAVEALKREFAPESTTDSPTQDRPVVTHVIFSDEGGPARRQLRLAGELPEPQAVEPPDLPA